MLRHPRPSRRRLLVRLALGGGAVLIVGSLAAGTIFAPTPLAPTGIVAGEVHVVDPPSPEPSPLASARASTVAVPAGITEPDDPAPAAVAEPGLTGYRWPIAHPRITLPFGLTPWGEWFVNGQRFHDGIDLATFCGDKIVAAHDGTVLAAGRQFDDFLGWIGDLSAYYKRLDAKKLWTTLPIVVVIDDGNGYRSVYAHFGKIKVHVGQVVHAGQLLGFEGMTGHATGCHLHYGLFSPFETASYSMDPAIVKRMKVPTAEIARVDPMTVFPQRSKPTPKPSAEVVTASSGPTPGAR